LSSNGKITVPDGKGPVMTKEAFNFFAKLHSFSVPRQVYRESPILYSGQALAFACHCLNVEPEDLPIFRDRPHSREVRRR